MLRRTRPFTPASTSSTSIPSHLARVWLCKHILQLFILPASNHSLVRWLSFLPRGRSTHRARAPPQLLCKAKSCFFDPRVSDLLRVPRLPVAPPSRGWTGMTSSRSRQRISSRAPETCYFDNFIPVFIHFFPRDLRRVLPTSLGQADRARKVPSPNLPHQQQVVGIAWLCVRGWVDLPCRWSGLWSRCPGRPSLNSSPWLFLFLCRRSTSPASERSGKKQQ